MKVTDERRERALGDMWMPGAVRWFEILESYVDLGEPDLTLHLRSDDEGELGRGVLEVGDGISVEPCVIQVRTIAGMREVDGFAALRLVSRDSGFGFEEVDPEIVSDHRTVRDAVKAALLLYVEQVIDDVVRAEMDSEHVREVEASR